MRKPSISLSTCSILLALLLCQRTDGQNLVPNPSFEDVNTCAEFSQPCSPSAWFYLSRRLTTGYFPRFHSATGQRHLQIVAVSRETVNRQYWETMLLCSLQAGERYEVTLKIASPGNPAPGPGNRMELNTKIPNLRDIGLWFTPHFVFVSGDSILQPRSYLSLTDATTKNLKNGWFEIKKEFTATANTPILILGNFSRTANADIIEQRGWSNQTIDVLVDDLSIIPVKGMTCPGAQKVKDSLYRITRRHSDNDPDDPDPDNTATIPPPVQNPDRSTEPRPVIDTPRTSPQAPVTDTIIIHNIQFDFDKYMVQNPDTLLRYRKLLTRPGIKKIQVVGFTDDIGSDVYNQDLSTKRAREIGRLLSLKFAIPAALIQAEGRGISRTYPTKELNRRVEIYIFHE